MSWYAGAASRTARASCRIIPALCFVVREDNWPAVRAPTRGHLSTQTHGEKHQSSIREVEVNLGDEMGSIFEAIMQRIRQCASYKACSLCPTTAPPVLRILCRGRPCTCLKVHAFKPSVPGVHCFSTCAVTCTRIRLSLGVKQGGNCL
jgi:hypothetical protein